MMLDGNPAGLWLVAMSPAVGSFLGVLIDRLPRGEDVVAARSACRACGTRLGPADMIPILSFALSRGRCRHCGAPIPAFLVYVEIAAIGAAVLAAIVADSPAQMALGAGYLWCLLALSVTDLRGFVLPLPLTAALLPLGLGLAAVGPGAEIWSAVAAAAAGSGAFLAIRIAYRHLRGREGLGLGDVWLMAGIGAATGPRLVAMVVLIAALAALLAAGLAAWRSGRRLHGALKLPFGTFLCAAAALVWLVNSAYAP